ncbi:hypothetical protein [Actinoplanes teichomyceticus]|uniref:Uncharacterized protein n=1 Tax=Actinoplanes teichomyceticus TaxID=1867 RepID=A0A561WA35_ACTTI|nr:hypothetical protein [Actinoplanes teichomyceticus]TWG20734.1 hypothetical protein FHX34_103263 [Actinoplanes teichomyceticus]GIF14390.1 hypothetical protein Ate01nite_44220 [Actinoplanes teichomyceticus]
MVAPARQARRHGPEVLTDFHCSDTWTAIGGNGWDTEDIQNSGTARENMATFDDRGRINPYVVRRR